VYLVKIVKIM